MKNIGMYFVVYNIYRVKYIAITIQRTRGEKGRRRREGEEQEEEKRKDKEHTGQIEDKLQYSMFKPYQYLHQI